MSMSKSLIDIGERMNLFLKYQFTKSTNQQITKLIMSIILKNNRLKLEIDNPGENYKFSRFDHSGKITQITLDDKYSFCTVENIKTFNKENQGQGLYNEFGIGDPVGFDDCEIGEQFLKIGVGLLTKKDHEAYDFMKAYEYEPFKINIFCGDDWIKFVTNPVNCRGYEVILTKFIKLTENSFIIQYELQNIGSKPINTSEYCHNFIAVNHLNIDENYGLKFPFKIDRSVMDEYVNTEDAVIFKDKRMIFKSTPENQFFFSHMEYNQDFKGKWEITNDKYGVAMKETTDFIPDKINVWGWKHVISTEIFYKISLDPGQKTNWQRKYEFNYL